MNQRTSIVNGFVVTVSLDNINISRNGSAVDFTPAESEKVPHLLAMASSMASSKAVLPYITSTPFRIIFFADGTMNLIHRDHPTNEGLKFEDKDIIMVSLPQDTMIISFSSSLKT